MDKKPGVMTLKKRLLRAGFEWPLIIFESEGQGHDMVVTVIGENLIIGCDSDHGKR